MILQNLTVDDDLSYKYIKKLRGGVKLYMLETKVCLSPISLKLKIENRN